MPDRHQRRYVWATRWYWWRYEIKAEQRRGGSALGRFPGGAEAKIGIGMTSDELWLYLLVFYVIIRRVR